MKTPMVLELTRIHIVKDSEVLIISRETNKYRKVSQTLRALIVG